jgi:XTP/dITP diphosphohydrolase
VTRRFDARELVLATHNMGKVEEMRALLAGHDIAISCARDHGIAEPVEDGSTFLDNARIKARAVSRATGRIVLADDSGLEVDALNGAPGVHTADWAETPAGRDFDHAMQRVHVALLASAAPLPWTACFRCVLVMAWPDGLEITTDGTVEGQLVWPTRGAHGHGFDPMFMPAGQSLTFAEMPFATKNALSHRGRALAALIDQVFT